MKNVSKPDAATSKESKYIDLLSIDELELKNNKAKFQAKQVSNNCNHTVFIGLLTKDGIFTYVNKLAFDLIGMKAEEVLDKPLPNIPCWSSSIVNRKLLHRAIKLAAKGDTIHFEIYIRDKHGKMCISNFFLYPLFNSKGEVSYLVPAIEDITSRHYLESNLQLTQFAVDHADDAIIQIGADGKVKYANESACRHLGYSHKQLIGMSIEEFDINSREIDWPSQWNILKSQGSRRSESIHSHSDGRKIPVEISATYFEYHGEGYCFLYIKDISEQKADAKRIEYLTHYDHMTRLPNRVLFTERLNEAINIAAKNETKLVIFCLGLDRFKLVNDTLGNVSGDEVLQITANRLISIVRDMDTVARIGGDEFAVLLAKSPQNNDDIVHTAQRILDVFNQPYLINRQEIYIMCSIGIATYPKGGRDADEILKNASAALQQSKKQGGNNYCVYTSNSCNRDPARWYWEADLRNALKNNQFEIHYQPRVESNTGRIFGAEALLRWRHPSKGLILPDQFINIAEETGLILPIGDWVLRNAIKQRKAWAEQGIPLARLGINLSARQFRQRNLAQTIEAIFEEVKLNPDLIELELTESLIMQDVAQAIQIMNELKQLGVHIALDDFGTGYSSLSYLRYFPIDTLKIDRSFVNEITFDKNSVAIAEAIIIMAHRLNLTVIAEGVETFEQLMVLRQGGCDQIQGFHFSKALPSEEMTMLLASEVAVKNWGEAYTYRH
ncbi:EAL domain-containing protein [Legionella gresilensis]|uniref:EAL domain-containing protein n=1 Tax=Legionella gresilensis TaxID=91823 RepID=UPI001041415F|nr:EAL domain-containing protein [Legionella gresilensis]